MPPSDEHQAPSRRMASYHTHKNNNASPSKNNKTKEWWQNSIVRRSVSFLEDELEQVVKSSPFLQQQQTAAQEDKIALLHRSEIKTGRRLGKGGFSYVYEIVDIQLDPSLNDSLTPTQQDARQHLAKTCFLESGKARYAMKCLQEQLLAAPKEFRYAASDLALEAAYLSGLQHESILPLRGLPIGGLQAFEEGRYDGYFIIMDRLEETLHDRLKQWQEQEQQQEDVVSLDSKMDVALQLASALNYLHSQRIVFRDLKPHNIGFTSDNKVQLFDFGLCRELPTGEDDDDQVYEMSGVGTRRYMAVELINDGKYNLKADVYGWSMICWEMLSLTKPYAPYSVEDHRIIVCQAGERPELDESWPQSLQNLLQASWMENVENRLTMQEVVSLLVSILQSRRKLSELVVQDDGSCAVQSSLCACTVQSSLCLESLAISRAAQSGVPELLAIPSKSMSFSDYDDSGRISLMDDSSSWYDIDIVKDMFKIPPNVPTDDKPTAIPRLPEPIAIQRTCTV